MIFGEKFERISSRPKNENFQFTQSSLFPSAHSNKDPDGQWLWPVWPDLAIFWILGNFLKPLATFNFPKSPTFLGKFCKDVKIFHFFSVINFGQVL